MDATDRPQPGSRTLAWAVLAASVAQVVAPVVTINGPGRSPGNGSGPDLLITPVGWAFSIWGVIYGLAIAQAIAVLVRGAGSVPRRLQVSQLALYLGGTVWILLAALDSSVATAIALVVMVVAGVAGVLSAVRAPIAPRWLSLLTRAGIGLYAGWVTAAVFLNASTAAVDLGLVDAGSLGWQLGVLVVATITLVALSLASRGTAAYAAAGTWALAGIAVTGSSNDDTAVLALAVALAVVLVGVLAASVARSRTARTARTIHTA